MATKKKATKRRKSSKARVGSTKKKACATVGSNVTIAGKRFKVKQYSKSKAAAKKVADAHRGKGKNKQARVSKTTCGWRVVTRG